MKLSEVINRTIKCTCGAEHRCDIEDLFIGKNAIDKLSDIAKKYSDIMLIADRNTYPLCGKRVEEILGTKMKGKIVFEDELLVPDESSVKRAEEKLPEKTDLVLGIGSGVINDICKYVSFNHGAKSGIIATATSMDGFASSGAAMIFGGMKTTFSTHAPSVIIGDTKILKDAPMDMIRSGYADIIGKYSSLNDWRLANIVMDETFCPYIYKIVKDSTDEVRDLADELTKRNPEAIGTLMEILVLVGVCLTLLGSTRPGSGSEHHLSHYFEITGLIDDKPYFFHGTDVGYSTVVTASLREQILKIKTPLFQKPDEEYRINEYMRIYKEVGKEVRELQESCGSYKRDLSPVYTQKWQEILSLMEECPTADEITAMLVRVGFDMSEFEKMYGQKKIDDGIKWGKDLKDRYSVLWLYNELKFSDDEETFEYMKKSVKNEIEALGALCDIMKPEPYLEAVRIIMNAKCTITTACGSSGFAAKKFAHALCCVECPAKFIAPSEAVHGGMGAMQAGDAIVFVSKGGRTDELIPIMKIAKAKKAKIIVVTQKEESELGKGADVVLKLPDNPESDRYGVMSTTSFATTMAIFNAIMVTIMEQKNYRLEDFALIHPGGGVGKDIN